MTNARQQAIDYLTERINELEGTKSKQQLKFLRTYKRRLAQILAS